MTYAYVTLIMFGDTYVPGALVLGYSLKQVSSVDRICMVTSDVSVIAKKHLSEFFIIKLIPYLNFKSKPFLISTAEQKKRYSSWISASYTKWQMLSFTAYDKVFFLDADTIVLKNIDEVFQFNTPAGVFTNPWSETYQKRGFLNPYKMIKPGEKIPRTNIDRAFKSRSSVVVGNSVLLSPDSDDHIGLLDMLGSNSGGDGFGRNVYSGNDEQAITWYYNSIGKQWTMLPPSLNTIPWHSNLINPDKTVKLSASKNLQEEKNDLPRLSKENILRAKIPLVIHFFGAQNVWDMNPFDPKAWIDIFAWWTLAFNYSRDYSPEPFIEKLFNRSAICDNQRLFSTTEKNNKDLLKKCYWCKYLGLPYDHYIFDGNSNLICPQLKRPIST